MSEWEFVKLADAPLEILDGDRGKNYPSQDEFSDSGYCLFLSTKNVRAIGFDFSDCQFISKERDELLRKGRLQRNDIVLTTRGTIGNLGFFNEKVSYERIRINSGMVIIRPGVDKLLPAFNFYTFRKLQSDFLTFTSGSAQPQLPIRDLKEIEISIPSLEEQKAIASVLSSLDDKIDLLHRQNTTLEAMAETLFRQWFVEKAQEGWEESTIDKIIEFNPPRKLSKGQVAPYLDMAGLDTTNFSATGWYLREFSSGTKFINNDTLLARITPCLENGKTGYVAFLSENEVGWGSTEFIVLRPKLGIHPFFAYVLARYQDFRDYAEGCMEGSSGRQRVNIDHLKQYQIRIPSNEIIKCFNEAVSAITPKLELNAKQIQTLEKLRENLLPKLMSGEVRV